MKKGAEIRSQTNLVLEPNGALGPALDCCQERTRLTGVGVWLSMARPRL